MASEWARKRAELLREEIWGAYESACEAEGAEGCEHTPDGDPLICWSCRERKFELVAESRIAAALDEARAEGRAEALGDAIPLKDLMAEALRRLLTEELARLTEETLPALGLEYREDDGPAPYWRNRRALEAEQKMREYQKKIKELELKVRTLRMLRAGEQPMRGPEEGE